MCGIAGVFTTRPLSSCESDVARIVQDQHVRGPDFNAIISIPGRCAGAVLGHNRLSIIDLSPTGNQPMWDGEQRLCIVFNGEVYNYVELRAELVALGHRFLSTSDTEVVLESFKRWGTEAFGRFNGMFAFALYDSHEERLYLVRDRFGVKPLYYVPAEDSLHFASTGKTLAKMFRLPPDLDYLARGVRYGLWEHDDSAPYIGMKALLPSHWLQAETAHAGHLTCSLHAYYDFKGRTDALADSLATVPVKEATDLVAGLLDDAVRVRLRADVPVAISLSGGLDSCTVAALAAGHPKERLQGFTFGNPLSSASEGPLAAQLGQMANIDVTYVWPNIDQICQCFGETLHAQVGPYISGSMMAQYMVFTAARAAGFKVLLGGQGGDEAFMGYHKFQVFRFRRLLTQRSYLEALWFALTLLPTVAAERELWVDTWNHRNRYLRRSGLGTVLRLPGTELAIGYSPADDLRRRQMLDVTLASLPTLLRYEDSNSMGNSIESRLPFLDYRVIELGVALPEALKLRTGRGKWIVRRAMADRLPATIRNARYKRGFDTQQNRWIDEGLGDHIRTLLRSHQDRLDDCLAPGSRIDEVFSNEQLKRRPSAFAEATTLLWIADSSHDATAA